MNQHEFPELLRGLKGQMRRIQEMGITELAGPKRKMPVRATCPDPAKGLERIRGEMGDCTRCKLCQGRTHIVFGVGNPKADLLFVGEGPGHDEDLQGEPFVGRAGQLLTKMIEAMGMKRNDVYIANIVKCRPPENRLPEADEVATCYPFLLKQIEVIRPKVIIALGNLAAQTLLQTKTGITSLRGQFHDFNGIPLMPTYHPAYLLRNPNMKKPCWEDLKKVIAALVSTRGEIPLSPRTPHL